MTYTKDRGRFSVLTKNLKAKLCSKAEDYPFSSFAEYLHESTYVDREFALGMLDLDAFVKYNNMPNTDVCMEISTPSRSAVTDSQAQSLIQKISRCKTIVEFQSLEELKKERFIKKIYSKGVSIRQLSRLTGITKGMIEKCLKT